MKNLIVTADDFGVSSAVNRAVIEAHCRGVLTSTSLMVAGEAAEEAVVLAKENPGLQVGLHLVLVQGYSVLPPGAIPNLVDAKRRFSDKVAASGVRYFFSPRARRQLAAECRAQVEKFLETGLALDHINGHNHLHIHPTILEIVIDLAREYKIPAVRLPRQPWRTLPFAQAVMAVVMAPWVARTRRRLKRSGIFFNDDIFGLFETGSMFEAAWLKLIPHIRDGVTEIYCHPAVETNGLKPNGASLEFAALVSPAVRAGLDAANIERTSFSAVVERTA